MIQRKQTLFLLQVAFLSLSLLFVPTQFIDFSHGEPLIAALIPVNYPGYMSTSGHFAAIALNAVGLILAFTTIFLFKKRELQVKLTYGLILIYVILTLMIAFCPFVAKADGLTVEASKHPFGYIICGVAVIAAFLAARFIKKDIELLKSADRIR